MDVRWASHALCPSRVRRCADDDGALSIAGVGVSAARWRPRRSSPENSRCVKRPEGAAGQPRTAAWAEPGRREGAPMSPPSVAPVARRAASPQAREIRPRLPLSDVGFAHIRRRRSPRLRHRDNHFFISRRIKSVRSTGDHGRRRSRSSLFLTVLCGVQGHVCP